MGRIICGKRRYTDECQVRAAGMVSLAEHGGKKKLWFYRCPTCHGYHLTASHKSRRFMITADEPVHLPAKVPA
jgi:hypothetical protein